jgi:hypothetical protein
MKALLKGTSQILLVIAGLLRFVGGRAISEFTKTDGVSAEMLRTARLLCSESSEWWRKTRRIISMTRTQTVSECNRDSHQLSS